MATNYEFGRISDAALISLCKAILKEFAAAKAILHYGDYGDITLNQDQPEVPDELRKSFTPATCLIVTVNIQEPGSTFTIDYRRGQTHRIVGGNWAWVSGGPFVDGMSLSGPGSDGASTYPALLPLISKFINMAPPLAAVGSGATLLDQSTAIVNSMAGAVATLIDHTAERQKQLDQTRDTLASEAEISLSARLKEVDVAYQERRQELDGREALLIEREANLDDRTNTHVRRDIQKKMAELTDTRLTANLLTRSNWNFAVPVILAVSAATVLAVIIAVEVASLNLASSRPDAAAALSRELLYGQIRIGLQSLGLAALIWFALRLATARYGQVSRWERDLHKFRLDTERAGFLVEGDLEARRAGGEGLPPVLVQSFSRGLFSGDGGHDSETDSLGEALQIVLGRAARLKLGPQGAEVEVNARGLRRARKDLKLADDEI